MRKTNKLLAGLLSLCLAVSVSAMPALAHRSHHLCGDLPSR